MLLLLNLTLFCISFIEGKSLQYNILILCIGSLRCDLYDKVNFVIIDSMRRVTLGDNNLSLNFTSAFPVKRQIFYHLLLKVKIKIIF